MLPKNDHMVQQLKQLSEVVKEIEDEENSAQSQAVKSMGALYLSQQILEEVENENLNSFLPGQVMKCKNSILFLCEDCVMSFLDILVKYLNLKCPVTHYIPAPG